MMKAFIGQDVDYVADKLVHQGLEKLVDVRGCFYRYIFSILDISSLLRSNKLYNIFISPIERLKTIKPGFGEFARFLHPHPGEFAVFFFVFLFFKETLMPGG